MKTIKINEKEFEIIEDYREALDKNELESKLTEYFDDYDYILGDWAYGKLRLKGFCTKENKLFKDINDYSKIEKYIKDNCAYNCRYFILKRK
ncbi:MAG: YutD family protein [Bacilli bacterium]|nr:YutD family protein [Bacilli bacterium]